MTQPQSNSNRRLIKILIGVAVGIAAVFLVLVMLGVALWLGFESM